MPNRIIKESICTSERLSKLSDFEFRLWIGLITQADDAGRGDARPAIIKGHIFPLRERVTIKDISNALNALAANGCVSLYKIGGKPYYWFPSWTAHQRIRDCKPKFPAPEDADLTDCGELRQVAADCGELRQVAADCGELRQVAAIIQSNTIQSEYESEYEDNARAREKPAKEKYGEFENVLLTADEFEKLVERFPNDYRERIEKLSMYVASTGKKYKSHYATILNWAKKDVQDKPKGTSASFMDIDF